MHSCADVSQTLRGAHQISQQFAPPSLSRRRHDAHRDDNLAAFFLNRDFPEYLDTHASPLSLAVAIDGKVSKRYSGLRYGYVFGYPSSQEKPGLQRRTAA